MDSERGEQYGPRFGTGDIIGCGLLTERRELFFTKNGAHLGVAFSEISAILYPTVGLHSPGERVTFNLGASPFAFDIDKLILSQREGRRAQILSTPMPPVDMNALVRAYLLHYNCADTLAAFEKGTESQAPASAASCSGAASSSAASSSAHAVTESAAKDADAVTDAATAADVAEAMDVADGDVGGGSAAGSSAAGGVAEAAAKGAGGSVSTDAGASAGGGAAAEQEEQDAPMPSSAAAMEAAMRRTMGPRGELRGRIGRGDVLGAMELTERYYPGLLERHGYLRFRLRCQHFIELLRAGEAMGAVAYAQRELAPYQTAASPPPSPTAAAELADVFALIAYEHPADAQGPASALLGDAYRERTADVLNGAVLELNGVPATCAIERLMRQLVVVTQVSREANMGYGEGFRLLETDEMLSGEAKQGREASQENPSSSQ